MIKTHNLGFPRIGKNRELKFALEKYWKNYLSYNKLNKIITNLQKLNLKYQKNLDFIPIGDFSYYDHVLDMSFILKNIPKRININFNNKIDKLNSYFKVARGYSVQYTDKLNKKINNNVTASKMTKWFNTNYHYIVPEFNENTKFSLDPSVLLEQIRTSNISVKKLKPVIIGPITYLWLGESKNNFNKFKLLPSLVSTYLSLLDQISTTGVKWIQIDEPILVTDLNLKWRHAFKFAYDIFKNRNIKLLLTTYFGKLKDNINFTCNLKIDGLHIDAINGYHEIPKIIKELPNKSILSIGIIDGKNIWKTNLNSIIKWLKPLNKLMKNRLWISPSCSLLHIPIDINCEKNINNEIKSWLAFSLQKLEEIKILSNAININNNFTQKQLIINKQLIKNRKISKLTKNYITKNKIKNIKKYFYKRKNNNFKRYKIQKKELNLPYLPITTIGSFPQTNKIRKARFKYKNKIINYSIYKKIIKKEIDFIIEQQEKLDLDILVNGEVERNDMVEYFAENFNGYIFSQFGWVQSYGSRCVKPPILFGDISRKKPITIDLTLYAQSKTKKIIKGILTGPVTMLNWSFVRDDQYKHLSCYQLALAIRDEVIDLEKSGIKIIQIDEAALREGLPLRKIEKKKYLKWAINSFRITSNFVKDKTQIHTHMCYSKFKDIISDISKMDVDVITIENFRSKTELLKYFKKNNYTGSIGPGIYDIHSTNIPNINYIIKLINKINKYIKKHKIWINPDCGLKTRTWNEIISSINNIVYSVKYLRKKYYDNK